MFADGEHRLSAERFNAEHLCCLEFIKESIANSKADKIVVLTHHVPSNTLSSEDFRGSMINGAICI